MAASWPTILNTLSTVIEAITPTVSSSIAFREIDNHEDIEKLPASQPFRCFFIEGGAAEMEQDVWTHNSIRINREFDVIVSYRSDRGPQSNDRSLEEMLGSDAELIISNLCKDSSRTTDNNWTTFSGFEIEKTDVRTYLHVRFTTNYDISFTV